MVAMNEIRRFGEKVGREFGAEREIVEEGKVLYEADDR